MASPSTCRSPRISFPLPDGFRREYRSNIAWRQLSGSRNNWYLVNVGRGKTKAKTDSTLFVADNYQGNGPGVLTSLRSKYISKNVIQAIVDDMGHKKGCQDDVWANFQTFCVKYPGKRVGLFRAIFTAVKPSVEASFTSSGYRLVISNETNATSTIHDYLFRDNDPQNPMIKIDVDCPAPDWDDWQHLKNIITEEREKSSLTLNEKKKHLELDLILWLESGGYRPPRPPGFSDLDSFYLTVNNFLESGFRGDAFLLEGSEDAILTQYPAIKYSTFVMIRDALNQNNVQGHVFKTVGFFRNHYNLIAHDAGTCCESVTAASRDRCRARRREQAFKDWLLGFFIPLATRMKTTHDTLEMSGVHGNTSTVQLYTGYAADRFGKKVVSSSGIVHCVEIKDRHPNHYNNPPTASPVVPRPGTSYEPTSAPSLKRKTSDDPTDWYDYLASIDRRLDKRLKKNSEPISATTSTSGSLPPRPRGPLPSLPETFPRASPMAPLHPRPIAPLPSRARVSRSHASTSVSRLPSGPQTNLQPRASYHFRN